MKMPSWLEKLREERLRKSYRNPGLAGLLSFFVMGLGQVYAGYIDRGIMLVFIHISAIFSGYSLYRKGVVFEFFSNFLHPLAMLGTFYIAGFVFVLLWIYNVKEAYYLALFAGFRDWFEVERVLIAGPTQDSGKWFLPAVFKALPSELKNGGIEFPQPLNFEIPHEKETAKPPSDHISADDEETEVFPEIHRNNHESKVSEKIRKILSHRWMKPFSKTSRFMKWAFIFILFALLSLFATPFILKKDGTKDTLSFSKQFVTSPALKDEALLSAAMMLKNGNLASGVSFLEREIEAGKDNEKIWKLLISFYEKLENPVELEKILKRYHEKFPNDFESLLKLAKIQFERKSFIEASRSLTSILNNNPANLLASFYLGSIYRELGISDEAISYLSSCVQADPLNPTFNLELAIAYFESGKYHLSAKHLEKCLSIDPKNEKALELSSKLHDGDKPILEPFAESKKTDFVAVPMNLNSQEAILAQSQLSNQTQLPSQSQSQILPQNLYQTQSLTPFPSQVQPQFQTTSNLEKKEKTSGVVLFAAPGYEEKNPPSHSLDHSESGLVRFVQSKPNSSKAASLKEKKVVEKKPASSTQEVEPEATTKLSTTLATSTRESESLDEMAMAQAVEDEKETKAKGKFTQGRDKYLSGKWEEALPFLLAYLKEKPDSEAYGMVGNIFAKLGMIEDAYSASLRSYKMGNRDLALLVRLGTLAESTGKFSEGVKILSETIKKSPHRLDLRLKYAKCLVGAGEKEKAKIELKAMLTSPSCTYSVKSLVESELLALGEKKDSVTSNGVFR
ncbi:MAG: hypothetical protein HQM08_02335 [Candidatus Riflebacteria bacterium]|nr:hypothetical protein [Candidatus Riflebacteria bacterium]